MTTLAQELERRGILRFRAVDADTSGCWHWWRGNHYLGSFDAFDGWKIIADHRNFSVDDHRKFCDNKSSNDGSNGRD